MPNNPVQVILNPSEFVLTEEPNPGGKRAEYFANRDEEFVRHRDMIVASIEQAVDELVTRDESFGVAAVKLQKSALAKSKRPTGSILKPKDAKIVGGGDIGELYTLVRPSGLRLMASRARAAEDELQWRERDGKVEANPSPARSDVGAIASFRLRNPSDKLILDLDEVKSRMLQRELPKSLVAKLYSFALEEFSDEWGEIIDFKAQLIRTLSNVFSVHCAQVDLLPNYLEVDFSSIGEKDTDKLTALLKFLGSSPVVEVVTLSPAIKPTGAPSQPFLPRHVVGTVPVHSSSPIVGIIDGGVSAQAFEDDWIVESRDVVFIPNQERGHGTAIAGILIDGHTDNHYLPADRPCRIFDIGIVPENPARRFQAYEDSWFSFYSQLEEQVREAAAIGVRIFNLSINAEQRLGELDYYGPFSRLLDRLALELNIIFVISVGNIEGVLERKPWAHTAREKVQQIADYRFPGQDLVLNPAKSLANVAVAAVEKMNNSDSVLPARFSRRGPGYQLSTKPDFAHFGGGLQGAEPLYSVDHEGYIQGFHGTSFSAPMVAKTLANLESSIEGQVSRELLLALAVHHAEVPVDFGHSSLGALQRDFVGFGVTPCAEEMLITNDSSITMVFEGRLRHRQVMYFPFNWPSALLNDGKCRGTASLTVVFRPIIDDAFGSELVRANVDATLQQFNEREGGFRSNWFDHHSGWESDRIENGLKWSPIKHRSKTSRTGKSVSSEWRLKVDCLSRYESEIPADGVRFCVVVTIADDRQEAPVFQQVLQQLRNSNAVLGEIRSHNRIRTSLNIS